MTEVNGWEMSPDPDCPVVADYMRTLWDDPMTWASGCGDEIADAFERRHLRECERCRQFAAANVEVAYA